MQEIFWHHRNKVWWRHDLVSGLNWNNVMTHHCQTWADRWNSILARSWFSEGSWPKSSKKCFSMLLLVRRRREDLRTNFIPLRFPPLVWIRCLVLRKDGILMSDQFCHDVRSSGIDQQVNHRCLIDGFCRLPQRQSYAFWSDYHAWLQSWLSEKQKQLPYRLQLCILCSALCPMLLPNTVSTFFHCSDFYNANSFGNSSQHVPTYLKGA